MAVELRAFRGAQDERLCCSERNWLRLANDRAGWADNLHDDMPFDERFDLLQRHRFPRRKGDVYGLPAVWLRNFLANQCVLVNDRVDRVSIGVRQEAADRQVLRVCMLRSQKIANRSFPPAVVHRENRFQILAAEASQWYIDLARHPVVNFARSDAYSFCIATVMMTHFLRSSYRSFVPQRLVVWDYCILWNGLGKCVGTDADFLLVGADNDESKGEMSNDERQTRGDERREKGDG